MKLKARFSVRTNRLPANFGAFQNVSDGGFERGYADGYGKGEAAGYEAGKAEGIEQGREAEYDRLVDPAKIIEKTVSSSVIRVDDVSEIPHKCTVSVDKDSSVTVCGNNLIDPVEYMRDSSVRTTLDGDVFTTTTVSSTVFVNTGWKEMQKTHPAGTYTFSVIPVSNDVKLQLYVYLANSRTELTNKFVNGDSGYSKTFTVDEEFYVSVGGGDETMWGTHSYKLQLEVGKIATAYEPYCGSTHAISAGQTIEVDSICPTMTLVADNDAAITFGYHKSYGAQTEYDRFWDSYQQNGERTIYQYAFAGTGWTDDTFKPKYDMTPVFANNMFNSSRITDLKKSLADSAVTLDFSKCTEFTHFFSGCPSSTMGELSTVSANSLQYLFAQRNYLVSIDKVILREDGSQTGLSQGFQELRELVQVRFAGKFGESVKFGRSQYLSADSVDSIIGALKDMTGATAQTLTFHAAVGAALSDAQKAAITAKNWTLVY